MSKNELKSALIILLISLSGVINKLSSQVLTQIIPDSAMIGDVIPWYFDDNDSSYSIPMSSDIDDTFIDSILQADSINGYKLNRYGVSVDANLTKSDGAYYSYGGYEFWKLKIIGNNASSLNLRFSNLHLPLNSLMYIYGYDKKMIQGPLDSALISDSTYNSDLIYGDSATIFVVMDSNFSSSFSLKVNSITYGFWDHTTYQFGDALDCQQNESCFGGWHNEADAVCMIIASDGRATGALLNNPCVDLKPYILTANHVVESADNDPTDWAFRFGYISPDCTPSSEPQSWLTFTDGAYTRATWDSTDFALLEYKNSIIGYSDLALAGWDRTFQEPTGVTFLHHPRADVMKRSFDAGQVIVDPNVPGAPLVDDHFYHYELEDGNLQGDIGVLESGSSGAPVFNNASQLVIGQHRGTNDDDVNCHDPIDYWGGTFNESWDGGGNSTNQLSHWLGGNDNPNTTSTVSVPGIDGNGVICNDNPIFQLINPLPNSTVTWEITSDVYSDPITGSGIEASLEPFTVGLEGVVGTVKYTLSNSDGCEPLNLSQDFWIGPPSFELVGEEELDCGERGVATVIFNGAKNQETTTDWDFTGDITGSGGAVIAKYTIDPQGQNYGGEVCATLTNICGSTTKCINVRINCSSSKKKESLANLSQNETEIKVSPNPSKDFLNIELKTNSKTISNEDLLKIKIYNYSGLLVKQKVFDRKTAISTKDLLDGMYIVEVKVLDSSQIIGHEKIVLD